MFVVGRIHYCKNVSSSKLTYRTCTILMNTPSFQMILQLHNSKGSRKSHSWEFPDRPVVRAQCFHCWNPGSIPAQGTKKEKKKE